METLTTATTQVVVSGAIVFKEEPHPVPARTAWRDAAASGCRNFHSPLLLSGVSPTRTDHNGALDGL
jgi:hypothetical protein